MHSRRPFSLVALFTLVLGGLAVPASARQAPAVDVGGQVTVLRLDVFDTTSVGGGVQASVNLTPHLAIDGLVSVFPGRERERGSPIESSRKILSLVGVRAGQTFGRVRLSARARPGFLNFAGQDTVLCVLIIPPPLSCIVAGGHTAFATEVGGGARIRLDANDRLHVNVDVGDLLVRYSPDEPFRRDDEFGEISDSLLTNNLIFNAGLSWRF